ncbi:hypothetical protein BDW66DRAFT_131058 [Aspergillus desertorum]
MIVEVKCRADSKRRSNSFFSSPLPRVAAAVKKNGAVRVNQKELHSSRSRGLVLASRYVAVVAQLLTLGMLFCA